MYMIGFDTRYSHIWEWDPGRASDYDIFLRYYFIKQAVRTQL